MLLDPLKHVLDQPAGAAALREASEGGKPYGQVFVKATSGAAAIRDHINEGINDVGDKRTDGRCPHCGTRKV